MPLFKDVAQGAEHLLPTAKRILASLKETLGKMTTVVQKRVYVSTGEKIHVRAVRAGQEWFDYIRIESASSGLPVAYRVGAFDYNSTVEFGVHNFDERNIGVLVSNTDSPPARFLVSGVGASPVLGNTASVVVDPTLSVASQNYKKRRELINLALSLGWGSMIWAVVDRCYPLRGLGYRLCHIRKVFENGATRIKMLFRFGAEGNFFYVGYVDEFEALHATTNPPWDFATLLKPVASPIPPTISSAQYSIDDTFGPSEDDDNFAAWAWYDIYPTIGAMGAYYSQAVTFDANFFHRVVDRHYFTVRLAADGQVEYIRDNGTTPFTDIYETFDPLSPPFSWGDYSIPRVGLDRTSLELAVYSAAGTHIITQAREPWDLKDFSPGPSGVGLDTPFSDNFVVLRSNLPGKQETITFKFFGESVASATVDSPYPLGISKGEQIRINIPAYNKTEDHLQPTTQLGFITFGPFSSSPNYRFSWREPRPVSPNHTLIFDPKADRYFYGVITDTSLYSAAASAYIENPTDVNAAAAMIHVITLFNNFASPDVIIRLMRPGAAVLLVSP